MTEKRFRLGSPFNGFVDVYDGEVVVASVRVVYAKHLLDLLNSLNDENEQLKQFKEDVFNKINMHLRMLPTARDTEFNEDDGDPSLYTGAIYMLETLKKEFSE